MNYLVYAFAMCGLLCSAISLGYAHSYDQRSKRMARLWLQRMGICAVVGLTLILWGVR